MTVFLPSTVETDLAKFALSLQQLAAGRSNAIGVVTLATSATSTVVSAINCAPGSTVFLFPKTAHAGTPALPNLTIQKQISTASGTYTPSANLLFALIEAVGGGGGGGGTQANSAIYDGGGGGGGGNYSRLLASAATIGASQAVTIGAAGTAGATGGGTGGAGGDTSVGSLCIAKGGSPGTGGTTTAGGTKGAGGVAGTGDLTVPGHAGANGMFFNAAASGVSMYGHGGEGGSSGLGFGAGGVPPAIANGGAAGTAAAGVAGSNYGAGGSGSISANNGSGNVGGAGAPGVVFITEYCLAASAAPIFVSSVGKQTFTISHDSSAVADRTFFYVCLG